MKIIIMAGGTGTRLWPLSRTSKPKQFQPLFGEETMLQMTVKRLLTHFTLNDIYVSTNAQYKNEVLSELPQLPENHIILEPEKRDTAPANGIATIAVDAKSDEALAFLAADHYIHKPQALCHILQLADNFLQTSPEYIVTLGITPTAPETGYGYIKYKQDSLVENQEQSVYAVEAFVEKPDFKTATDYLADGHYVWNSGMFVVQKKRLLEMYQEYLPETGKILVELNQNKLKNLDVLYPLTDAISFDYGIMEKAEYIAVIPADIGWSDIGSWSALKDMLQTDEITVTHKGNAQHFDIESEHILVHSHNNNKVIATIGIRDIVIVDTGDALLVSHIDKVQEVKKINTLLKLANLEDKV
ncbi:MAG: sugar phosphate nucleotidyltransferase [Candidatus Paceibacterota bacterium]